ncbi:unnamed protein product [Nyctereutes procyonoides]|uniref:(raccoon dog) hypothetical protein n=1 Tax=Nyctereutes procyonoides TaxID=34880 RepID=A0A811YE22_NYCPR|nr:unnamed protein product [Nyctereutes procyonoides]
MKRVLVLLEASMVADMAPSHNLNSSIISSTVFLFFLFFSFLFLFCF